MSRRSRSALILAPVIAALSIFFGISTAQAANSVVDFFGSAASGTAEGQFSTGASGPGGVAVNQAGNDTTGSAGANPGDVYVVDRGNNRIQQFDADGNFVRTFGANVGGVGVDVCTASCVAGGASNAAGGLNAPQGVAIDQTEGLVYVTDQTNRRVDVFSASGVFQAAFGWGVDTGAAAFELCTTASICQAPNTTSATGGEAGKFGTAIGAPAVAPNGDILIADKANRRVDVFTPTIDGSGVVTAVDFTRAFGKDVISAGPNDNGTNFEICTAADTCKQGATGNGSGAFSSNQPSSVAVTSNNRIYAVEAGGNSRVQKFDSDGTPLVASFAAADLAQSGSPAPVDATVDRTNNDVLVVKPCNSTICPAAATSSERRVLQFDSGGSPLDAHAADAGITSVNALAQNQSSGRIYLTTNAGSNRGVFILDDLLPSPAAVMDPITVHDDTTATLSGTVDPMGGEVSCSFEYSTDGSNWTQKNEPDCASLTDGGGAQAVTEDITGLDPNNQYSVRINVSRPFNPGSGNSSVEQFTTDAVDPIVLDVRAGLITDTSALLRGEINPKGTATEYHFEYGETAAYGELTPVGSAGAGQSAVEVTAEIGDLSPETSYHFRLVADGAAVVEGDDKTLTTRATPGPTPECSNAEFRTGYSAQLPDCRAYELVSSSDDEGAQVVGQAGRPGSGMAAEDGNRFSYIANDSIPSIDTTGRFFMGARTDDGWEQKGLIPPTGPAKTFLCPLYNTSVVDYSSDLTKGVLEIGYGQGLGCGPADPPLDPNTPPGVGNQFVSDYAGDTHDLVSLSPVAGAPAQPEIRGAADDLSHVVFGSQAQLTADAPSGQNHLYDWSSDGIALVNQVPFGVNTSCEDADCVVAANFVMAAVAVKDVRTETNPVSADGSRIFFRANGNLYVRIDAERTVQVDAAAPGAPGPGGGAGADNNGFQGASPDGSLVYLKLQPSAGVTADTQAGSGDNLYEVNVDTGDVRNIAPGPDVRLTSLTARSDDGEYLYFTARGVLAPGAVAGDRNLYLFHDNEVRLVATVGGDVVGGGEINCPPTTACGVRTSPDGRYFAFNSPVNLTSFNSDGKYEIYIYSADTEEIVCASCATSGAKPTDNTAILAIPANGTPLGGTGGLTFLPRFLSDSGQLVFDTDQALLPRDTNGTTDVYSYGDDDLSLISTGKSPDASVFLEISVSGDDAFFLTTQALVEADGDSAYDVYDARVDGGFASQNKAADAECQGDACQVEPKNPPADDQPGSGDVTGSGNATLDPNCLNKEAKADKKAVDAKKAKKKAKKASKKAKKASGKKAKKLKKKARKAKRKGRVAQRAADKAERKLNNCRSSK